MIFPVGIAAALALGLGLVLQQRVAARDQGDAPLSLHLLAYLMRTPEWWLGIGAMVVGQLLGAWALQLGSVSLVEALLSTYLLFAFVVAGVFARHRANWHEVAGALLLSTALGVFIGVGRPVATHRTPGWTTVVPSLAVIVGIVTLLVLVARRRRASTEAVLIATAAGVLYGFQDAGTRAALLSLDGRGVGRTLTDTPWPYLVVVSAVVGVLLAQSAYRAASIDYSLPPTAAAEPLVGVALGIGVFGDHLAASSTDVVIEALCVLGMLGGVFLIGRSPVLATAGAVASQT